MEIKEFFTYVTGLTPTPEQAKFLEDAVNLDEHKLLISAGRQSGKTLCSAVVVLWFVFEYPEPLKILLVSAQQNVLYLHILNIFRRMKDVDERFRNVKDGGMILEDTPWNVVPLRGFTTVKGTIVYVRGSTDKQIRGLPADIVVIDEAAEVKNDIILTAMGNLSGRISKFILISTPHVLNSLFVEWASEKKPTFKIFTWSSENLSWHNPEIIKEKKKRMSRQKYAVEVLGRPPTKAERAFFPSKHIDKSVREVEAIREGGQLSRLEIGIDCGVAVTCLIVTERLGSSRRKIIFRKIWKNKSIEEIGTEILDIINKFNPYITKIDSKPEEFKRWFTLHAKYKVTFIDFIKHKEQMMGQLQRLIREHRIIIPQEFPDIIIALRKYRYRKGKEAKTTGSDIVEALALSCYEPIEPLSGSSYGMIYFPETE